jgi:L-aminopeptidase/D-esterase-like protein
LATGKKKLPEIPGFFVAPQAQAVNEIGHVASNCMSRAIICGILAAKSQFGMTAFRDLKDR